MEYNDNLVPWKDKISFKNLLERIDESRKLFPNVLSRLDNALNLEEYKVNLKEGLIKSVDIKTVIRKLKYNFSDFTFSQKGNTIIGMFDGVIDEIYFNRLQQLLNNLGWFFSGMSFSTTVLSKFNKEHFINYDDLKFFVCEAKYDIKEFITPNIAYHATLEVNWEKIKRIGLAPKSRSKKSYHPERVYLAKTIKDAEDIAILLYKELLRNDKNTIYHKINNWSILEADLSNLDYLEIYMDPNFKGGWYTLNNIPPQNLKLIKEVNF